MKRLLPILLALLLLVGCAAPAVAPDSAGTPTTERQASADESLPVENPTERENASYPEPTAGTQPGTVPEPETDTALPTEPMPETDPALLTEPEPETDPEPIEEPTVSGLEAVTEERFLFLRQEQFPEETVGPDLRGTPVTLEEIRAWAAAQEAIPRTHWFDGDFADQPLLLELLDYAFFNGYIAVCFPEEPGAEPDLTSLQWKELYLMYRLDSAYFSGGSVSALWDPEAGDPPPEAEDLCLLYLKNLNPEAMTRFLPALEKAKQIVAELPEDLDDYDTALRLYAYLTENVSYDSLGICYYEEEWCQLYDALIKGVCVCTGYSDAFYYLCSLAGIDCLCIYGLAHETDFSTAENHQWNLACLYGNWYCFDATWDTKSFYDAGKLFFAVSAAAMDGYAKRDVNLWVKPCYPETPASFEPAGLWNDSPEGALRTYLWLRRYCCGMQARSFPVYLGLMPYYGASLTALPGQFQRTRIAYADFVEIMERYVTPLCYRKEFEGKYYKEDGGMLAISSAAGTEQGYMICSVTGSGTRWTAVLETENGAAVQADFTVDEQDGLYRINTIRFK